MSRFILALFDFFQTHKWAMYSLLAIIIIYCISGIALLKLDNDIFSILPQHKRDRSYESQMQGLRSNRDMALILHIEAKNDTSLTVLTDAAAAWENSILRSRFLSAHYDTSAIRLSGAVRKQIFDSLFYTLPLLLDSADFEAIHRKLEDSVLQKTLANNAKLSSGLMQIGTAHFISLDPLHLTSNILEKLKTFQVMPSLHQVNGFQVSKSEQSLLLKLGALGGDSLEIDRRLLDTLEQKRQAISRIFPQVEVYMMGAPKAKLDNRSVAISDSLITSLISLVCILFLLYYFFRSRSVPLISLVPSILGFAFAIASLGFMGVKVVSMAFSAATIILAMGINYAIHLINAFYFSGSRRDAIQEVVNPMLMGNLTTIAAFYMLNSSDSMLLRQYSLIAVFSLLMGVFVTLVFLPHWLPRTSSALYIPRWIRRFSEIEFHRSKWLIGVVVIGTVLLWGPSMRVKFQGDLSKLNYMPPMESKGMELLKNDLGINLAPTMLLVTGDNQDTVLHRYERARRQLLARSPGLIIPDITAVLPPTDEQQLNSRWWKSFWTQSQKDRIIKNGNHSPDLRQQAKLHSFIDTLDYLGNNAKPGLISTFLKHKLLGSFISSDTAGNITLKVPIGGQVTSDAGSGDYLLYNRKEFTNSVAEFIQTEFSSLLWASGIVVFFLLLLFYGRLELAILSFLPMLISWIWILGLANLLHIDIHIINLILCTFIFGLCDDYSLFMIDGMTRETRYGEQLLKRDRQIITISILITVISLMALLFGRHPAFHSFAILAVIGLMVVLFISLTLQPLLYRYFISSRVNRGNRPASIITTFFSTLTFTIFILLGLIMSVIGIILQLTFLIRVPLIKRIYLWIIKVGGRFVVWTSPYTRFKIENKHFYNPGKPGIIIANHQSHIDLLAIPWIDERIVVLGNKWVYNNPVYGLMLRTAGYIPGFKDLALVEKLTARRIQQKCSVLIFPEGSRSYDANIRRFHKGAFYLAEKLQLPIYPVLMHGFSDILTKGEQHIKPGTGTMRLLPPITPDDLSWGTDYTSRRKSIVAYFNAEYQKMRDDLETPTYNFTTLCANYLYKGPSLYWYAKIKTLHEGLFIKINERIPKEAMVTDIGCGYGMLPLMLALCGYRRQIIGLDYDIEKIETAAHAYSLVKYPGLSFRPIDLMTEYEPFPSSDVFILYDVLHYLPVEVQMKLVGDCIEKLNPGGQIFIRDAFVKNGIVKRTGLIEKISTKVMKFNKTSGALFFSEISWLEQIAQAKGLGFEVLESSDRSADTLLCLTLQNTLNAG